jgi:hypothetical protein
VILIGEEYRDREREQATFTNHSLGVDYSLFKIEMKDLLLERLEI